MIYYIVVIGAVLACAFAQMLLKRAAREGYTPFWRQYINPWVIAGYGIMFGAMVVNIACMHHGVQLKELSIIESLSYLFVPALSWMIFGERISRRKAIAITLIIIGVVVFFL